MMTEDSELVLCLTCKTKKPASDMAVNRQRVKGYIPKCKACKNAAGAAYKKSHPQKNREWNRAGQLRASERLAEQKRKWHKEHPELEMARYRSEFGTEKAKARRTLKAAVRRGRISKPSACQDCGRSDLIIHGHHHDYAKPLDVEWLCPWCHGKRHRLPDTGELA
jgi:hypothetical protein